MKCAHIVVVQARPVQVISQPVQTVKARDMSVSEDNLYSELYKAKKYVLHVMVLVKLLKINVKIVVVKATTTREKLLRFIFQQVLNPDNKSFPVVMVKEVLTVVLMETYILKSLLRNTHTSSVKVMISP